MGFLAHSLQMYVATMPDQSLENEEGLKSLNIFTGTLR